MDARANISGSATAKAVRNHSGYSLLVDELKRPELSEACDLQNNQKLDRKISSLCYHLSFQKNLSSLFDALITFALLDLS